MRSIPIVYDVLLRLEIEAHDEGAALRIIEADVAEFGIKRATIQSKFEIIRDDSSSISGKDNLSRHTNGFVIFNGEQKHALLAKIARAIEAALDGDASEGNALVNELTEQFKYLVCNTLDGVQLSFPDNIRHLQ